MTSIEKINIGVIGCGKISSIYFQMLQTFDILNVIACADLDMERARMQAESFHIPRAVHVEELLADPEIEPVVNLTIPSAHAEVGLATIAAGKALYNEKPLALTRAGASTISSSTDSRGTRWLCPRQPASDPRGIRRG
jgi:predicted dehydrogenase